VGAEWVLSPDELWICDNGYIAGDFFQGRHNKVHSRNYRASPYGCMVIQTGARTAIRLHDRGQTANVGNALSLGLLRMR
jgi:hypothetical protein